MQLKQYNCHNTFPCKLVLHAFTVNKTGNSYEEGLVVFRPRKQRDLESQFNYYYYYY